jgi:hypothetical protein
VLGIWATPGRGVLTSGEEADNESAYCRHRLDSRRGCCRSTDARDICMIFYLTAGVIAIAIAFALALWYVMREDFGCGLDCDNCGGGDDQRSDS